MRVSLGIDCGSRTVKAVLLDSITKEIIDYYVVENGLFPIKNINRLINMIMDKNNLNPSNIMAIGGTGYGRNSVSLANLERFIDSQVPINKFSEIICHGKGSYYLMPNCKTIIDIGGQDSKVIMVNNDGKAIDFVMNDKCAAGTGRFLEKLAQILELGIKELDSLALNHDKVITISSTCVVFAESEIIGLLANEEKAENIIYSIYLSIAKRILSQTGTMEISKPISFVGGVAHHKTIKQIFAELFESEIFTPENPSITGALGSALLALESNQR